MKYVIWCHYELEAANIAEAGVRADIDNQRPGFEIDDIVLNDHE